MKIQENKGLLIQQDGRNVSRKHGKEGDFRRIMDEMMGPMEKEAGQVVPGNLDPAINGVQILQGAEKVNMGSVRPEGQVLVDELKRTLDLIDFYALKLADVSIPVEGMGPLVDHLEERLEGLKRLENDPGLPKPLQSIVSEVVLTMGTEIAKFRRGDYQ
ncbi:MAG: hypothetical protein JRH13_02530 [Deltaproteobacteria bacterium]|nr:hypothetical protein [Deltaproteobacteria bacterium]MBW2017374.1 hypothetical protein [Deltaproteobacteria bacterium]MBW2128222.1 hypothetical protein [Deltaproteobacteria bacterium]MBW2303248.1 hypothetical protein [Deltaproteobacteria bacterium]